MDAAEMHDFETAGRRVLAELRRRLGHEVWMLTRASGEHGVVLQAEGQLGALAEGSLLRWSDTLCWRMVHGPSALRFAHDLRAVPALRDAPLVAAAGVGSYIGLPLRREDGSLFGTLNAHGSGARAPLSSDEQSLVLLLTELLTTALQLELRCGEASRQNERLSLEALADGITQLHGPGAFESLLEAEERRCHRFGHPGAVMMLRLQGSDGGDESQLRAAEALQEAVREHDVLARLAPDTFAVLAVECDEAGCASQLRRVREGLQEMGLRAGIASANRLPTGTLSQAWQQAQHQLVADSLN
jgi:diguanylate cyclase (GGDEF)-like protein